MLDQTDLDILQLLEQNSRMQWREIGEIVNLTGQAVANRVQNMERLGVIKRFTIEVNRDVPSQPIISFVTIFMKSNEHDAFIHFCKNETFIRTVYRVSGDGCYWLEVVVNSTEELDFILNQILEHGNYKMQMSINQIK